MATSTTPETAGIRGRVRHAGAPQPGARVLWLTPALDDVVAAGESGADGGFALEGPGGGAVVLARLRGPVLGAVSAGATAPGEVALDLSEAPAPVWPVVLEAVGDVPAELTVLCTPAQLPGLPDGALQWIHRLGPDTNETFAVLALRERAELQVQAGEWRFAAMHAEGGRVREAAAGRTTWYTAAAAVDGDPVPCDGAGARVRIDRALTVTLEIARTTA